jgi:hypothetical protein
MLITAHAGGEQGPGQRDPALVGDASNILAPSALHGFAGGRTVSSSWAVLVDEDAGQLLRPLRSLGISFCGGDDGAFHQDVPVQDRPWTESACITSPWRRRRSPPPHPPRQRGSRVARTARGQCSGCVRGLRGPGGARPGGGGGGSHGQDRKLHLDRPVCRW